MRSSPISSPDAAPPEAEILALGTKLLELARRQLRAGHLDLNRGITGALVGRHPFGDFGRSGGGRKAGGADSLLHFVWPRSWAERLLRSAW